MKLDEGGKSDAIRYNSELGVLYGLIGNGKFNPKRPEKSLPASKLSNPTSCYRDIVRLVAPNFMPNIFMIWANRAPIIKEKMSPAIEFPIDVDILIMADWTWKYKNDTDNLIKPIVDLLKRAEIIPDDTTRYVNSVKIRYLQGFKQPAICISYVTTE